MANFPFIQFGLLFILTCWTTGSTGAAFSFEEEFQQLKENYIQMKEIVKNLESKVTELELKDAQMQEKITEQDLLLTSLLLREKNERTAAADSNFVLINQSPVAINGLPSSCGDLKMIGHSLNGFYSIVGSAMMESVYCDFSKLPSDAGFQKWIGFDDIKSVPVHFYVQRNSHFNTTGIPIPFSLAQVNEGNAMDLSSGIFTAPRTGVYFFSFTGLVSLPSTTTLVYLDLGLHLNGGLIGTGHADTTNTSIGPFVPLTLQSMLNLKSGDQVTARINSMSPGSYLYDNGGHFTHFTGFMLEEEIVASL